LNNTALKNNRILILSLLIFCCVIFACGCGKLKTGQGASLTIKSIKNANYHFYDVPQFNVSKLTDGNFISVPEAPEYDYLGYVEYHDGLEAFGDLNDDDFTDVAAIINLKPGGSGIFVRLAVLINQDGIPKHVATASLGDRVIVKDVYIDIGGIIYVDTLTHRNDALCCPSRRVITRYRLEANQLIGLGKE